MHALCSICALITDCSTFPRLQEHPVGALSGAGQNGIGSEAVGHWAKYAATSFPYSQEYAYKLLDGAEDDVKAGTGGRTWFQHDSATQFMKDWYMTQPHARTQILFQSHTSIHCLLSVTAFAVQLVKADGSAQTSAVILDCARVRVAPSRASKAARSLLNDMVRSVGVCKL